MERAKNGQRRYVDTKILIFSGDAEHSGQKGKKKTEREEGKTRENEERRRGNVQRWNRHWLVSHEPVSQRDREDNIKASSQTTFLGYKIFSFAAKNKTRACVKCTD